MNNQNPRRDQQAASATEQQQQQHHQQQQASGSSEKPLLIEPLLLTSPTPSEPPPPLPFSLSHNPLASSASLHNKENTQVQVKSGDKRQQQLSSPVRNASNDLLGTSVEQQQSLRKSRLEAEFEDDSIGSRKSTNKSPDNKRHQRQDHIQQQTKALSRAANDSGIEASASHSEEARRLLGSESCSYTDCACCTSRASRANHSFRRSAPIGDENNNSNMSLASQTIKLMPAYFVSELIGTFLLVVIGDGTIATYVLTRRPIDVFCACFAFGVGAMIASYVSGKISGAQLNPAATVAFALDNRLKWELVPVYLIAQYLGGFLAALVLFLNNIEGINALDGGLHTAMGSDNATGGIFATYPAPYVSVWSCLLDQIVGTAVLLFSLSAVGDKNNLGLEDRFQPPIVALVIGLVCLAFNPNCGAIFNPARDLAPRLLTAIFGYDGVWAPIDGTYWILAGVVGPHIGAILGVFGYKYLIGAALEAHKRHMQMIQNSVVIGCGASGEASFDEKKAPRLQSFQQHHHHGATHQMTTTTPTQKCKEPSDYGSASVTR